MAGADSGASKIYRKGATSYFSKGEQHSLTKIFRSGDSGENVKQFRRQLDQTATFYKFSNVQKTEVLPFLLTGNANVWFSASLHLAGKTYDQLCTALMKQFLSESDIWLLRKQLLNKKQTENESVAQFASKTRKLFALKIYQSRKACIHKRPKT